MDIYYIEILLDIYKLINFSSQKKKYIYILDMSSNATSNSSASRGKKVAAGTPVSPPTKSKPAASRPAATQRALRSLREKVLTKASVARASVSEDSENSHVTDTVQVTGAIERVETWKQMDIPPRKILSDDEEESDTNSITLESCRIGRVSMLPSTVSRSGVAMDLANKHANELLQKGKDALEAAGNMKRECKVTAVECLQSLYETCLALSDSRSRHKFNLEKERSRHARELVAIERAHNKQLTEVHRHLTSEVVTARNDLEATLSEAKAIRGWLSFETQEPYRKIGETEKAVKEIDATVKRMSQSAAQAEERGGKELEPLKDEQRRLSINITAMSKQIDELRRGTERAEGTHRKLQEVSNKTLALLQEQPAQIDPTNVTSSNTRMEEELIAVRETLNNIKGKLQEPAAPPPTSNLKKELAPLAERLEAVSSELRSMRQAKERTPPPPVASVGTEMVLAEIKKMTRPTYAQVAVKTPPPKPKPNPNHTVIISSTDPKSTCDNVIERIKQALDCKKTGAKVEKIRKARNQKVVVSCTNKEDLNLVQAQMRKTDCLRVEMAKKQNPLVKVLDVLSYHTDVELIDHIMAQNQHLLGDVDVKESTIRVRYRKRARNQHECHPVLEVSPAIHKRFLEAGKIYVGLQRRPVLDQSPLVQCIKCLDYGHTQKSCPDKESLCSYCGEAHTWEKCPKRLSGNPAKCKNCQRAGAADEDATHNAFSEECRERHKWDAIARSRISYC